MTINVSSIILMSYSEFDRFLVGYIILVFFQNCFNPGPRGFSVRPGIFFMKSKTNKYILQAAALER